MRRVFPAAAVLLSLALPLGALTLSVEAPDDLWTSWERIAALHPLPDSVLAVKVVAGTPGAAPGEESRLLVRLGAPAGFRVAARIPLAPVGRLGDEREDVSSKDIQSGGIPVAPLAAIRLPSMALSVDGLTADQPGYALEGEVALRLESTDPVLVGWFDSLPRATAASADITWIGAVGDIMPARGVDAVLLGVDGPRRVFGDTLEILAGCGIVMGNLESAATLRGQRAAKTYTFRFAPDALQALASTGLTYLSLANNHTFDFGRRGFLDTMEGLARWGIGTSGAGANAAEAGKPLVIRRGNADVRILSFAAYPVDRTGFDGRSTAKAGQDTPGTLWLDDAGLAAASRAFAGSGFSIAMVHGGVEWSAKPTEEQERLYRALVDAGADLVVGSHPHVLQGMEARDGGLIAYSLGNFLFPGMEGTPGGEDSVILKLGILGGAIRYVRPFPVRLSGGTVRRAGSDAAARALRALTRSLAAGK